MAKIAPRSEFLQLEGIQLDSLCRLCGNMNINLIPVIAEDGQETELLQKIVTHLKILVNPEDVLPKKLCIHCTNTLVSWHSFYESCRETNEKFHAMISCAKNGGIVEVSEDLQPEVLPEDGEEAEMDEYIEFLDKEDCEDENVDLLNEEEEHLLPGEEDLGDARRQRLQRRRRRSKKRKRKKCSFCMGTFSTDMQLKEHTKQEHIDRVFLCDQCENYVPREELIQHMITHLAPQPTNSQELPPEVLQETPKETNEEEKEEEAKENRPLTTFKLKCPQCPKEFSKSGLQYHIRQFHEKVKDAKCGICSKVFGCGSTLRNHMKYKHENVRNFHCSACPKAFKTQSSLYIHRKSVHEAVQRFSCELCYKKFPFRQQLKLHLLTHTKEKTHFCRICQKGFTVRSNLVKHLKTHADLPDLKCHICYFVTSQKRYLAQHMKRKHLVALGR